MRTARWYADLECVGNVKATFQQRHHDVRLVLHLVFLDLLVPLALVDEEDPTQARGVHVELALAQVDREGHVDLAPHALQILPGALDALVLDDVDVALPQLGCLQTNGALAHSLELQEVVLHPAVGVPMEEMLLAGNRHLQVAEEDPAGATARTVERSLTDPGRRLLLDPTDEAAPDSLEEAHVPQPGLPLGVDGVALLEDVERAEAMRLLDDGPQSLQGVVLGPVAEVAPTQLGGMDDVLAAAGVGLLLLGLDPAADIADEYRLVTDEVTQTAVYDLGTAGTASRWH